MSGPDELDLNLEAMREAVKKAEEEEQGILRDVEGMVE